MGAASRKSPRSWASAKVWFIAGIKRVNPSILTQREENQNQDLQRENERLKTLLRQTEMERDILKKALRSTPEPFSAGVNNEISIHLAM